MLENAAYCSEILLGGVLQPACPGSDSFLWTLQQDTQISPSYLGQGFYPAFYTNTQDELWDLA